MGTSKHQRSIPKRKHVAFKYVCLRANRNIKHPEKKVVIATVLFPCWLPALSREVLTEGGHQKNLEITWALLHVAELPLIPRIKHELEWARQEKGHWIMEGAIFYILPSSDAGMYLSCIGLQAINCTLPYPSHHHWKIFFSTYQPRRKICYHQLIRLLQVPVVM